MLFPHNIYFHVVEAGGLSLQLSVTAWTGHKIYGTTIIQIVSCAFKYKNS